MSGYRPITDMWILARPKVKYHGAYPAGFLHRARQLLGVHDGDCVLHVCSGKVREYPYRGFGEFDWTVDVDPALHPPWPANPKMKHPRHTVRDVVKDGVPKCHFTIGDSNDTEDWDAILMDPPYTQHDAEQYGDAPLPQVGPLLKSALSVVRPGGRVGVLHYEVPRPPKDAKFVALVGVWCGYGNNMRAYSVFERSM